MDDALLGAVLERLEQRPLTTQAEGLLLAACTGDDELQSALGGAVLARPLRSDQRDERPEVAYLESLEVAGFRGIGPSAILPLSPGPGFTLVVGRNGSGKSSFSEALELLLTGEVRRWAERAVVWHEGWRNLHHSSASIRLGLAVQGAGRATAELTWGEGQELGDVETTVQVAGEKRKGLDRLGWGEAIRAFRPFLSHSELEALLGRPSELYDLLAAVLGLDDLTATADRLKLAARTAEAPLSEAKKTLAPLLSRLGQSDDERAVACVSALTKRALDIDGAERVATGGQPVVSGGAHDTLRHLSELRRPAVDEVTATVEALREAARQLETVSGTEAGQALKLADLLDAALAHHREHGDVDCPVCGRKGALDSAWRAETEATVARLRTDAAAANDAHRAAQVALIGSNKLLLPEPEELQAEIVDGTSKVRSLWQAWLLVPGTDDAAALRARADHFEEQGEELISAVNRVREAASSKLAEQEDRWSPLAAEVASWCSTARAALVRAQQATVLKEADKWLKDAIDDLRNRRLEPLAKQCTAIWEQLRQESNVALGAIRLTGSATRRQVDFQVTVDGTEGAALSVMSQGEVNALALSVFLPRVTLPASPFGFLVIDDPVQAMDPAKVEGLARVFSDAARERQVIVFTHDDRLPEAVRRLGLPATVLEVTRRPGSIVDVRLALDPPGRAIQDARAVSADPGVPEEIARRVVAGLCRMALETAFAEVFRRNRLDGGESHQAVEDDLLATSTSLTARAALALFGDAGRGGDVLSKLNGWGGRWAGDTYLACNKGAHGPYEHDLGALITDTERLVNKIRANVT